jgi:hypothetical protein
MSLSSRARRALIIVSLVMGSFAWAPGSAHAQCAMCRAALASPEGQQLAAALRAGILVLLAAPVASFATVAVLAVRRQRRRDRVSVQ